VYFEIGEVPSPKISNGENVGAGIDKNTSLPDAMLCSSLKGGKTCHTCDRFRMIAN